MLIQHLFQFGVSETNELFAPLRHTEIVHFGLDSGRILPSNPLLCTFLFQTESCCSQKNSKIFYSIFLSFEKEEQNRCMLRNIYFLNLEISEAQ